MSVGSKKKDDCEKMIRRLKSEQKPAAYYQQIGKEMKVLS